MFRSRRNRAKTSQTFFNFIVVLFSDYCGEILTIVIYLTKYSEVMPWSRRSSMWKYITKLSLSSLFNQDTEGSSISIHFQEEVRFSGWWRTLNHMTLRKIVRQTDSSSPGPLFLEEKCARVINQLACCIKQCSQLKHAHQVYVL